MSSPSQCYLNCNLGFFDISHTFGLFSFVLTTNVIFALFPVSETRQMGRLKLFASENLARLWSWKYKKSNTSGQNTQRQSEECTKTSNTVVPVLVLGLFRPFLLWRFRMRMGIIPSVSDSGWKWGPSVPDFVIRNCLFGRDVYTEEVFEVRATVKSYPSSTSDKNSFYPPHSWPSLDAASSVQSLPLTTRQHSCYFSWLGLGWRRNCQCLHSWTVREGSTSLFGCVLLCFIDPILWNRYGPRISSCQQTLDNNLGFFGFWFLVCYAATQLATQLQQRCIQVVCSNKKARKRLTESNGTPAMELGHMNVVLKQTFAYAYIQTNDE